MSRWMRCPYKRRSPTLVTGTYTYFELPLKKVVTNHTLESRLGTLGGRGARTARSRRSVAPSTSHYPLGELLQLVLLLLVCYMSTTASPFVTSPTHPVRGGKHSSSHSHAKLTFMRACRASSGCHPGLHTRMPQASCQDSAAESRQQATPSPGSRPRHARTPVACQWHADGMAQGLECANATRTQTHTHLDTLGTIKRVAQTMPCPPLALPPRLRLPFPTLSACKTSRKPLSGGRTISALRAALRTALHTAH